MFARQLQHDTRIGVRAIRPLVLLFGMVTALPGHTQTLAAASPELETVVVSAAREPLPLARVGSAISVLDRETLARRQATSLGEMLRALPGIAVSRAGGVGAQSQLRVRGAEANQVMVLVDGIPVNDASQGDEFNIAHLFNHQLSQVELLRGPQSSLWGSDALAGVISVETTRPQAGLNLSGFGEGGSDDYHHAGANLGWASDQAFMRVGLNNLATDGHNVSRQGDEEDGYRNLSASLRGGVEVGDTLSFTTAWHLLDSTTDFDSVDFATGLPMDRDNETQADQLYGQVRATLDLRDGRWRQALSVSSGNNDNSNSIENPFASGGFDRSEASAKRLQFAYQTHIDLHPTHSVSAALEHEAVDFKQRGAASFFGDPNRDESMRSDALAIEYRGQFGNNVFLQASVRHDDNSDFDDATTWRTNAVWWVSEETKLRAGLGSGVKNPTFTERFGFFTNFVGNADLMPEKSLSWELGWDQSVGDDFDLQLTFFKTRLQDEINGFLFVPAVGAFTAANVNGESNRQGVEASVQWALREDLNLAAAYTWLDATEDMASREVDEIRRPRHMASLEIVWQPSQWLILGLRGDHNGAQDDFFFPPAPPFQERVELDDFTLITATVEFEVTDGVSLYARLENALDDRYEEVFGFRAPGRTFVAGIRLSNR